MEKIIGGQGTGKTKTLIEMAHRENAVIVCETPERMIGKIHGYDYFGIQCISYAEYIGLKAEGQTQTGKKYAVDDVEALLRYISDGTIAFSVSN
ncbi:MAG: hypothetical protein Q4E54_05110 [Lachnospiraceae bacterium]|nr:hypothetical protein [Lachnospiraceae bacterium]